MTEHLKPSTYEEPQNPVGNVAELFAGVGGFRIGLARSGWKTIFSNQWEPSTKSQHASDVYSARFGGAGHTNVDIATINALPDGVDLLVGGFPCQDYSVAKSLNTAKGLEGKKGVLWWEILRLATKHEPKFIFLENVDRLLKSPSKQRGRDFAIMLKTLGDLGYLIEWRVVNAAEYGFPQRRIRVFIVASKQTESVQLTKDAARTLLTNTGVLARALPVANDLIDFNNFELIDSADVISENFNVGGQLSPFKTSGVYSSGQVFTAKCSAIRSVNPRVLGDILEPAKDVPSEYWVDETRIKEWEYLKGAKTIERTHVSGASYKYSEGKMAFPDLLTNPSRTLLTGEGGTSPSRFKHIIQQDGKWRRLTPIEMERLNGFPDDWTATGANGEKITPIKRAFFMGNALVIGLIEKVGKVLADEIKSSR
jgi:DNA (cytosine-5)-methyltransferase 1